MARFSVPTTARLPSSLRVDATNPAVVKSLNRLSREALISLALDWLDDESLPNAVPYIERRDEDDEADDDLYPPCQSIDDLQQLYIDMQQQKGSKRDVVSRIVEGDWRIGLTLYQLAMADMAYFEQNPTSQKWSAYSILPLKQPSQDAGEDQVLKVDKENLKVPRFHPSTFLQNLQTHVLPDVKAHYHFHRPKDIPVLILRIFVVDSPYNTGSALSGRDAGGATNFDSSRTVYIAFPDGSPSLYITKSQATGSAGSGESKSLQSLIVDGVPKALSRPRERYTLKSGNLSSKNLDALLEKKGSGRMTAAGGGWSIYTNESTKISPLDTILPSPPLSRESLLTSLKRGAPLTVRQQASKKARLAAKARFGDTGIVTDGKGVEKVDIVIQDPFPTNVDLGEADESGNEDGADDGRKSRRKSKIDAVIREANVATEEDGRNDAATSQRWTPTIKVSFSGNHVWAGVRQLVEAGIIDGEKMPGWMTGEEGVTTGLVRHGRIRGHKGSGM
ncbi:centromere protein Chl4/mis15/CENP-N [Fusarium flagelliforme]|uniref:Trfa protein n=1 Tax=Fusarium flagelliforme TaxID=2675880 RepID=A0A395N6D4_9HYPO|nr:centromere protein Chl4/mis15/CENP-N [Fusarium flagelliforme]KAH7192252.1 centromere protein Chl4/mis15/CENP-N [Fusarium flagelliforme]RFN55430.1 trfa protein [Fusarium flagelliforme]